MQMKAGHKRGLSFYTRALDKWLLTGFYVPQHSAACGPCRTQCTDSLASENIPKTQYQGRVTRSAQSAGVQKLPCSWMSGWKTMPNGLWVPQPTGSVTVGRACANGVAEHWDCRMSRELCLTSDCRSFCFYITRDGWWPKNP